MVVVKWSAYWVLSSNPAEANIFFYKICVWTEWQKNESKQKEAGVGPSFPKKHLFITLAPGNQIFFT